MGSRWGRKGSEDHSVDTSLDLCAPRRDYTRDYLPEPDPTCNLSGNRTSFIRPHDSAARLFRNAQITKSYKGERERWERDKKSFSGKRHTSAWGLRDECYRLGRFQMVLPNLSAMIRLSKDVFRSTEAYPSSRWLIHLDIRIPGTRSHGSWFGFWDVLGGEIGRIGGLGGLCDGCRIGLDSGIRRTGVGAHNIGEGGLL